MTSLEIDEKLKRTISLDCKYVMQTYNRLPVAFVSGSGTKLRDSQGREYLDLVAGLGAVLLGHCHPAVTEAIMTQAKKLIHTTNLFFIEPQAELARMLVESSFPSRVYFCNSGSEANEVAIKLARKYHYLKGGPRGKIVCAQSSFHGRTLATLSATGQPEKWEPFKPIVEGFVHIPFNDVAKLLKEVDEDTSAVMLEPVQGEGGINPASGEFLEAARNTCNECGALLIFDEVQTYGRTGKLFAFETYGVEPDVVTLAKGLANGVPIGAVIAAEACSGALSKGDHGSTFGGNFLACSAAKATIGAITSLNLPEKASSVGKFILDGLIDIAGRHSIVKEARGMGMMLAIEFKQNIAREVVIRCLERGLVVNDVNEHTVRLLPSLVLSEEEAAYGLSIISDVVDGLGG
ncbi:MAG: aspartate aminotransferase family protein [Actinomycetota bacterium]|nr:aspartate aminotransferase family protein [Actinomycetota bacterium]